jgi:hypothetical protein
VTIALGFLCPDGIVLCSDRQMTDSAAGLKYQKCKLSWMSGLFAPGISFTFASAYAGDPEAVKIMRTEIKERLGEEMAKSKLVGFQAPKARKALEKIFNNKHAKHLQMLIGIRFHSGEMCLFKTSGKKVVDARTEYIGSGDSSALRYLADFLLPSYIPSISQAQVLGAYLISVANEYVDGCSGGPDFHTIAGNGMTGDSAGGVFPNQKERFKYCEGEAGRALRELLFSGGTKALEIVNPKPAV